ncbi:hypothetical protein [Pseudoalteromonas sp. T1lg23B]|nr:hypothetical protein [Pseudoalteromonas sp. T1lg23B]
MRDLLMFLAGVFVSFTYPDIGQYLFGWIQVGIEVAMNFIQNYR